MSPAAAASNHATAADEEDHEDDASDAATSTADDHDTVDSSSKVPAEERWDVMYERLKHWKKKHGNVNVPSRCPEEPQLGFWVSTQRRQFRKLLDKCPQRLPSGLNAERKRKLDELGFQWSAKDPNSIPWESRFKQLSNFVTKFGHALVPIKWKHNPQLASWVSRQRQEYRQRAKGMPSRLTDERLAQLDGIGFVWEPKRGAPRRDETLRELPSTSSNPAHHPVDSQSAALAGAAFGASAAAHSMEPSTPSTVRHDGLWLSSTSGQNILDSPFVHVSRSHSVPASASSSSIYSDAAASPMPPHHHAISTSQIAAAATAGGANAAQPLSPSLLEALSRNSRLADIHALRQASSLLPNPAASSVLSGRYNHQHTTSSDFLLAQQRAILLQGLDGFQTTRDALSGLSHTSSLMPLLRNHQTSSLRNHNQASPNASLNDRLLRAALHESISRRALEEFHAENIGRILPEPPNMASNSRAMMPPGAAAPAPSMAAAVQPSDANTEALLLEQIRRSANTNEESLLEQLRRSGNYPSYFR